MRCVLCNEVIPEPYLKATMCQTGPCRLQRARAAQQKHRAQRRAGVPVRVPKPKSPKQRTTVPVERPLVLTTEEAARIEATIAAHLERIRRLRARGGA